MQDDENIVSVWQALRETGKPIVMYGMGDGAVKIVSVMEAQGIKPAAFMASDEFVRGHSFLGYEVKKLSDIQAQYEDFVIVVCFGSALPDVMDRLYALSEQYELYAPDVPVIGGGLFDEEYLAEHKNEIAEVRKMLADEQSKKVFDCWLRYRLTGKISYLKSCETPKDEAYSLLNIGREETYIDLGAYTGDTVEEFLKLTDKEFTEIYAVEPDQRNYAKMRRRLYMLGSGIFHPINAIAWNEDTVLDFYRRGGRNSSLNGGKGRAIPTDAKRVDTILGGKKATLLKLDVEGAEKEALEGAEKTIRTYKPRIILSLYHRTEDMLALPKQIKALNGGYRLYLRHHPYIPAWDTNLYCI